MNVKLAYGMLEEIKEMTTDAMKALNKGDIEKAKLEIGEITLKGKKD